MASKRPPEIALLVSTYQRPGHLQRALLSIALQEGVDGLIEVVVTDDGSTDETADVVDEFAGQVDFPVGFVTHPHQAFQLARCRNEGVTASTAPYLMFLDGDCVLPRRYVWQHLQWRRPGVALSGDAVRLSFCQSTLLTPRRIRSRDVASLASRRDLWRLAKLQWKSHFYNLIRHERKPALFGAGASMWRQDYERVNGYDENFQGWGCEDDDLRWRLGRAGVRARSIARSAYTLHIWHPADTSTPRVWKQGLNVAYHKRPGKLARCMNGLVKRSWQDVRVRLLGDDSNLLAAPLRRLFPHSLRESDGEKPEVEILIAPSSRRFSGQAECNILIVPDGAGPAGGQRAHADYVLSPQAPLRVPTLDILAAEKLKDALDAAVGRRLPEVNQPDLAAA